MGVSAAWIVATASGPMRSHGCARTTLIDNATWMTREAGMRLAPAASARGYLYELRLFTALRIPRPGQRPKDCLQPARSACPDS